MPLSEKPLLSSLAPFLVALVVGLVLLWVSRLGLAAWHFTAINDVNGWAAVLLQGLRVDVATMCMLLGIPAALYMLLPPGIVGLKGMRLLFAAWLTLSLVVLLALEAVTPAFMAEYGLRPNRLVIDYISYPGEVLPMLVKSHLPLMLVLPLLVAAVSWFLFRFNAKLLQRNYLPAHWLLRLGVASLIVLVSAMGVRSTLGHRPMNPAMLAFSTNATVNVLPLNSFYSLAHAVREHLREDIGSRIYDDTLTEDAVVARIRSQVVSTNAQLVPSEHPLLVRRQPVHQGAPRNLVIILEESLGAQFIGRLGGKPLSPNFDRLSEQGWAFDRLYATGTRSIRGIEAVLSGFPPTPSQGVLKRPRSQKDFFTLASLLQRHGYDTAFHYGGESHFDNMRGFFLGNGFERVIEEKDHASPTFKGSWGVSDEDVFNSADADFDRLHAAGKPFFGFIFTSSNHEPFEFPDERIELYEQPKGTRNNAAKYADHALGEFFSKAMASDYWEDTVFLVVADHDSKAFGQSLVPVDNFHIPGLIIGSGIEPRRDPRLASQIDLAPTLLSLIGIDTPTPLIGRDLNRADAGENRAIMQYDNNYAWMTDEAVIILQPGKTASRYTYTPGSPLSANGDVSHTAERAVKESAMWGTFAYENGWHRLP